MALTIDVVKKKLVQSGVVWSPFLLICMTAVCVHGLDPATAQDVIVYLQQRTGLSTLTGQHNEPNSSPALWSRKVKDITGVFPAMWEGDFLYLADDVNHRVTMITEAISQWKNGSLVGLMWHQCPPTMSEPCTFSNLTTSLSDAQWTDVVTAGTPLNQAWKTKLDNIIDPYLQQLQDIGIPVLWRPWHGSNVASMWWGGRHNESVLLFQLTHEYMTVEKGLTNLIWVWSVNVTDGGNNSTSSTLRSFYPGDQYVDVVALDCWSFPSTAWYQASQAIAGNKPMALAEISVIPTPSQLTVQPNWTYFSEWGSQLNQSNNNSAIKLTYLVDSVRVLHRGDIQLPNVTVYNTTSRNTTSRNTTSPNTTSRRSQKNYGLVVGASVASVVTVAVGVTLWMLNLGVCARGRKPWLENVMFEKNLLWPREFTYRDLTVATNNFSDENLLGSGGYGQVYKGTFSNGTTTMAVKRIKRESHKGEREFLAELCAVSQVRHRNLVQLHGWCREQDKLFLVYEYMANTSLDRWLFPKKGEVNPATLVWEVRYNIVTGVAAAVLYMHDEWDQCILHRDIKPNNVMLDAEFTAHLGDFGLATLIEHDAAANTSLGGGTPGYIAPEMHQSLKPTKKSDIYSFGVLALEVACGRRTVDLTLPSDEIVLADWVWRAHEAGELLRVVDARLRSDYDPDQMTTMLQLGLWCCHPDPNARPTMRLVGQWLKSEAPVPALPASKPLVKYSLQPTIKDSNGSIELQLAVEAANSGASVSSFSSISSYSGRS
jgi:serine/threonine protein kinase